MKQLPKLADLHHDVQTAFKNDELNLLLNQPPSQSWIKKHPMTGLPYMPIDKIEFLLTYIFQEWYVEVKEVQALFQSIAVTVALYYKNPLTGAWCKTEGVGASPIQTDKGASAADLGAIKNSAVQMALPSAKSYAIKDAAEHLGILFGRDLNRKDTIMFAGAYGGTPEPEQPPLIHPVPLREEAVMEETHWNHTPEREMPEPAHHNGYQQTANPLTFNPSNL